MEIEEEIPTLKERRSTGTGRVAGWQAKSSGRPVPSEERPRPLWRRLRTCASVEPTLLAPLYKDSSIMTSVVSARRWHPCCPGCASSWRCLPPRADPFRHCVGGAASACRHHAGKVQKILAITSEKSKLRAPQRPGGFVSCSVKNTYLMSRRAPRA